MKLRGILKSSFVIVLTLMLVVYVDNFKYFIAALLPHEVAHYLMVKIRGYKLVNVEFIPLGFNMNIKEEFIKPLDDILISLSGPLINFVFFALLFIWNPDVEWLIMLKNANLALFVFNILPAGFLDGARILKAVIKSRVSFYFSYRISSLNGISLGCIIILASLWSGEAARTALLIILGGILVFKSVKEMGSIMVNTIRDTIFKGQYSKEIKYYDITLRAFSKQTKLVDIIRFFCFNKYYIILLKEENNLNCSISETELIKAYCISGNITLYEAFKASREE